MAEKIFAESGGSEYFLNLVIAGAVIPYESFLQTIQQPIKIKVIRRLCHHVKLRHP